MADIFSRVKRSRVMAAIRSRGNKETELRLRKLFRMASITGWRRHLKIPGNPDFVFRRLRLAVFVDGCFWHACPQHGRRPDSNPTYWLPKLERTRARDASATQLLRRRGWTVLRIWEHELRHEERVLARCMAALNRAKKRQTNFIVRNPAATRSARRRPFSPPRGRSNNRSPLSAAEPRDFRN